MITNAWPNIGFTVMAWARPTLVYIVCKRQQDFKTVESLIERNVKMMRQPIGQDLEMKTEGQRKWIDEIIFAECSLELKPDDIIMFGCETGEKFRVVSKTDWSQYGYVEYKLKSDYKK